MAFDVGDVVLVHFVYRDQQGELQCKPRPAIVYEVSGDDERILIQITKKNRSDKLLGIWVLKDSSRGKKMGIILDSFINITYKKEVSRRDIIRVIGRCDFMDEIEKLEKQ